MSPLRIALAIAAVMAAAAAPAAQSPDNAALVARARAIHDRVITLDTHVDINPRDFTADRNYTQRLETQVNLPKMEEGGLDAAFFIVYVGQGALTPGRLRPRLPAGGREVRRDPPSGRGDRAETDRTGPDRRRRAAGWPRRAGRSRRSASRTPIRSAPTSPGQGVPRPRRPLHVAGPQRPQPVRRLQHRRAHRHVLHRDSARSAARPSRR